MTARAANPKISVVLTTHNRHEYLSEAIESLLRQSESDFELLVVDDGSTDPQPREIVARYARKDQRIHPLFLGNNLGLSTARNKGLEAATGEYICFHDDDDVSHPDRLKKQLRFLQDNPQVAAVTGRLALCSADLTVQRIWGSRKTHIVPPRPPEKNWQRFSVGNMASMARQTCLAEVGGYRNWFQVVEDWDLTFRLQDRYETAAIPDIAVYYRQHESLRLTQQIFLWHYSSAAILCAWCRRSGRKEPIGDQVRPQDLIPMAKTLPPTLMQPIIHSGANTICDAISNSHYDIALEVFRSLQALCTEAELANISGDALLHAVPGLHAANNNISGDALAQVDAPAQVQATDGKAWQELQRLFPQKPSQTKVLAHLQGPAMRQLLQSNNAGQLKAAVRYASGLASSRRGRKIARRIRRRARRLALRMLKFGYWFA